MTDGAVTQTFPDDAITQTFPDDAITHTFWRVLQASTDGESCWIG